MLSWSNLQVSMLIRKNLTDRARDFNIILDDVAITELSFGREYAAAVEAKQVKWKIFDLFLMNIEYITNLRFAYLRMQIIFHCNLVSWVTK